MYIEITFCSVKFWRIYKFGDVFIHIWNRFDVELTKITQLELNLCLFDRYTCQSLYSFFKIRRAVIKTNNSLNLSKNPFRDISTFTTSKTQEIFYFVLFNNFKNKSSFNIIVEFSHLLSEFFLGNHLLYTLFCL